MGQTISIPANYQVSLADYADIVNDSYTVERTSGDVQDGWRIPGFSPIDKTVRGPAASIHARVVEGKKNGWRIFMDNGPKDIDEMSGGWRRIGTIWPTRLSGDVEAIQKWRNDFLLILEGLEVKRAAEDKAVQPSVND